MQNGRPTVDSPPSAQTPDDTGSRPRRALPASVRRHIQYFSGRTCPECGRVIDGDTLVRHIDHIVPHSVGGEDVIFNLEPLCADCNLAKGTDITPRAQALMDLHARRRRETQRYFQDAGAHIIGNEQLRAPQEEAYIAVKDYFDGAWTAPAMVVMPTGVGKSLFLAAAPYGVAEGRVLLIAPNLTIKHGLEEKLTGPESSAYRRFGILGPKERLPSVVVLGSGTVNREDCLRADLVIANIQQVQGWLPLFPSDFFDLIVVDEAHHAAADSWQNVHEAFPNAKAVYATATPFRSDGQTIVAERVHTTTLAEAIADGYVKNVARATARAAEMTFVVEDEERTYSLEEILTMREETWFSRGVALSELCNRTIAQRAISILLEKRKTGVRHQIIAAACSVDHARQLEVIFASYGLSATYVASRGMTLDERERRIDAFDRGEHDVIVHVGILGEGYDNPNISIAAIFRPFRTVPPYAQFVGRAIRHIASASEDTDNIAHVVDHVGLDLDELWQYFSDEEEQARTRNRFEERSEGGGGERERSERDEAEVTHEIIEGFDIDVFVNMPGMDLGAIRNGMGTIESALEKLRAEGVQVPDPEVIQRFILDMNRPGGADGADGARNATDPTGICGDGAAPAHRPDKERQARRKKLDRTVQRQAGQILRTMRIDGEDDDLVATIGHGKENGNYAVVVRALNRALNEVMGKPKSNSRRNSWLSAEFKEAETKLPGVAEQLIQRIEAETGYRQDAFRGGFPPFSS